MLSGPHLAATAALAPAAAAHALLLLIVRYMTAAAPPTTNITAHPLMNVVHTVTRNALILLTHALVLSQLHTAALQLLFDRALALVLVLLAVAVVSVLVHVEETTTTHAPLLFDTLLMSLAIVLTITVQAVPLLEITILLIAAVSTRIVMAVVVVIVQLETMMTIYVMPHLQVTLPFTLMEALTLHLHLCCRIIQRRTTPQRRPTLQGHHRLGDHPINALADSVEVVGLANHRNENLYLIASDFLL